MDVFKQTPTAHVLHGFNVSDHGAGSTDKILPFLAEEGFQINDFDYGWMGLLGVRYRDKPLAKRLKKLVKPGDIGVGHSNGCAILAACSDLGAPFAGLVLINPALENDRVVGKQVQWVHVYHNQGDTTVSTSELLDWLPWYWKKSHPWGDMGRVGFTGDDSRYKNWDCGVWKPHIFGHSDIFRHMDKWGPRIAYNARHALTI